MWEPSDLQTKLLEWGIHSVGTLQSNRVRGCALKSEQQLKKEGRGAFDCWTDPDAGINIIRWFDNRAVTLSSTYVATEPMCEVRRFDRKAAKQVSVKCPAIVNHYNQHMGGVDKFDMLMALYRCEHKTRKWYRPIFLWTLHLCVVNGWLHYRRDCKQLNESVRMDLLEFTTKVATALIMQGKPSGSITPRKRGRPSAANTSQLVENEPEKKVLRTRQFSPIEEVAKDGFAHWPEMVTVSSRKRCKKCQVLTQTRCMKCAIHLCLRPGRNCFVEYHQ